MVELPKVTQEFDANTDPYVAGINRMITANELFIKSIEQAITKVEELALAINALDGKTIRINVIYDYINQPPELAPQIQTVRRVYTGNEPTVTGGVQNVQRVFTGSEGGVSPITQPVTESGFSSSDIAAQVAAIENETNALRALTPQLASAANEANLLRDAQAAVSFQSTETGAKLYDEAAALNRLYDSLDQTSVTVGEMRANLSQLNDIFNSLDFNRLTQGFVNAANDGLALRNATEAFAASIGGVPRDLTETGAAMDILSRSSMQTIVALNAMREGLANIQFARSIQDLSLFRSTMQQVTAEAIMASNDTDQLAATIRNLSIDLQDANSGGLPELIASLVKQRTEASAAQAAMSSLAKVYTDGAILSGAMAFGITGIGVAIHLVTMGVMEFLAVFLPAMYAAAAGAAVMMQGAQLVATHLQGVYTAAEALGPMVGETAGQMLGLGDSLQKAQNMANPGVYELLGEAIRGVNSSFGQLNSQGLSTFGQLGLDVTHMLDQFGASIDAQLSSNMGKVQALLSNAIQDLREFGQIFGNLGHAILNFAAAMPGAAEIALKVIDGISGVIKAISSLPAPFITAIMVIEEMYRWSGLLAGAFGVIGKAISAFGSLGIPILGVIGANVARMFANIVDGLGGFVINMASGLEKVAGLISVELVGTIDEAATGIVGKLGEVGAFLTGPWGTAVGLAAVALGALVLAIVHGQTATQQWISSLQKSVSEATNLQVLNVIAQQMRSTSDALSQNYAVLATRQAEVTGGSGRMGAAMEHGTQATSQAAEAISNLDDYQQSLIATNLQVVDSAGKISKQFGTSFTGALALADLAGVNLSKTTVEFGKNINAAGIQLETMEQGFAQMDQTGGTLANTMNAINIEAGIQASEVSKVNGAWDQFIQLSTSLTGGYTQLNLDMQQMGNTAQTVGSKITAFTGNTQMSVTQIAQSLTSFSGSSAQTWQSFNQSVSQANTFMDNLRTAAVAGVVSNQQYGESAAYVVGQLTPYAAQSKAALAEVMAIAQESGGPAYEASKSLAQNYSTLNDWVKQNTVTSGQFANILGNDTVALSNVSAVAKTFAGTLQSDVINAIAAAGADTSKITSLTNAYTDALAKYGAQAPQTQAAQAALTAALSKYGITGTDATQIENELSSSYAKNTDTVNAGAGARAQLQNDINKILGSVPTAKDDMATYTNAILNHTDTTNAGRSARQQLIQDITNVTGNSKQATTWVNNLTTAIKNIQSKTITIHENGQGQYTITGSAIAASQGAGGSGNAAGGLAGGGVIPGYDPGHDSVHALLSPGEGVLIPQAVRAMGGARGISAINSAAQHFASGGTVNDSYSGNFQGMAGWTTAENQKFINTMTAAMESAMTAAAKAAAAAAATAALGTAVAGSDFNNLVAVAKYLMAHGASRAAAAGIAGTIMGESGGSPEAVGSGGFGLIGWTGNTIGLPAGYHGPTGNATYDLDVQMAGVLGYINANGGLGPLNSAALSGGYVGAGDLFSSKYERPLVTYSDTRPATAAAVYAVLDQGGWLMPGLTLAYNGTGAPEKVTTGGAAGEEGYIHNVINLDGQKIWENFQKRTLQYNLRNQGGSTGIWSNR